MAELRIMDTPTYQPTYVRNPQLGFLFENRYGMVCLHRGDAEARRTAWDRVAERLLTRAALNARVNNYFFPSVGFSVAPAGFASAGFAVGGSPGFDSGVSLAR